MAPAPELSGDTPHDATVSTRRHRRIPWAAMAAMVTVVIALVAGPASPATAYPPDPPDPTTSRAHLDELVVEAEGELRGL